MNQATIRKCLYLLVVLVFLLSACQPQNPTATPQNQETQVSDFAQQTLNAMTPEAAVTLSPTEVPPTVEPTATATATKAPTATQAPIMVGPTNFPANVNPLTGLTVSDPTILNRRPVMVKISNWPASVRPQSGLSSADLIFEYYIGEGMNRFIALFYGQNASNVGSIRSGRVIDAQLAPLYQAVLSSSGADPSVEQKIDRALGNRVINEGAGACPMFCRDPKIPSPNNLFADTAKITEFAQSSGADPKTKPNLDGMRFETAAPQGGKDASQLAVIFNEVNRGEWRYDVASSTYMRWIENTDTNNKVTMIPLTDNNTKLQLAFDNVVVVYAFHTEVASTIFEVDMNKNTEGRKATLFRDGKAYDGIWKSNGIDKPMSFFTTDGKPLPFKPGNTWFAIMGSNSKMIEKSGKWEVQFYLP